MDFEENVRAIAGSLASSQRRAKEAGQQARDAVAFHAPHVLRRFTDIAAAFDVSAQHLGQGGIYARRDDHGYHTVELAIIGLHIMLDHDDGDAQLSWLAGDAAGNRTVTLETPTTEIDALLLDAVSAFARTLAAVETAASDGVAMGEEYDV